jgi:signal transduction histidine kinase
VKTRVTLFATLACALVFAIVGGVLIAETGRRERASLDRDLRALATRLQAPARRLQTPQLERLAGDASVRVVRRGDAVYDNHAAGTLPIPKAGLSTLTDANGKSWRALRRNRLIVARPLAPTEERIGASRRTIALASALGLLACAAAVWLVTARALRPLSRLRASAAGVSTTRDLTTRIDPPGPAEIDEVIGELNAMLARLQSSVAATERFTADAGHELRTPLTSIRANVASLRHGLDPQIVEELERDVARLTTLLDGLQALARGDGGTAGREPVDVAEVADAAVADARRRHPGVRFEFGEMTELRVMGDESGLRSVIDNLLENAARHGATRVMIALRADRVTVDDDGPGIPEGERERVFERFARGPGGGSGLGLAIVAQQAELHGGRVFAEDSPLGGARVVFTMRA